MKKINQTSEVVIFLLFPSLLFPQIQRWVYRYNGSGNSMDWAYSIIYGSDGNLYVAGNTYESGSSNDFTIMSLTTNGTLRWIYRYNGPANGFDLSNSIVEGGDGNIYATGYSDGSGTSSDLVVISLTKTGQERWVYRYNNPSNWGDYGYKIVYGNDENLYITGLSSNPATHWDLIVISLTSNGQERWIYKYIGPQDDVGRDIVYGEDGNIYVVGETENEAGNEVFDFLIISLNNNGQERWVYRYNGPANETDGGYAICYGGDGNIYATGQSKGAGTAYDFPIISLTTNGEERWVYRYTTPYELDDIGECITYGLDNNIYAGGTAGYEYPGVSDFTVLSVDTNGNERWVDRYYQGVVPHIASSITYGTNHKIYATGYLAGPQYYETLLGVICYTPQGERKWVYTYDTTIANLDRGNSIVYGGDGYIYVAGYGKGVSDDWLIISLEDTTTTKINENLSERTFLIYPFFNFFKDKIILYSGLYPRFLKISLYNNSGMCIFDKTILLNEKFLTIKDEEIKNLPKGIYFLKILSNKKEMVKFKLIKF